MDTGSGFPTIHVPIILDGWSEGVSQGMPGYQGPPLIVLDGSDVTQTVGPGLDFAGQDRHQQPPHPRIERQCGPGTGPRPLEIRRWPGGRRDSDSDRGGLSLAGTSPAENVIVQGNYIGVGPNGKFLEPNDVYGVLVQGNNNTIGGTTAADA